MEYASYVEYGHRQEPGRYVPALGKRLKNGSPVHHLVPPAGSPAASPFQGDLLQAGKHPLRRIIALSVWLFFRFREILDAELVYLERAAPEILEQKMKRFLEEHMR